MGRVLLPLCLAFLLCSISACATKVVNFKTNGPAKVALLESGKLDAATDPLGDTPLTVDIDQLRGKVVKISQPGKIPVFWVVSDAAGDTTDAIVTLVDAPTSSSSSLAGSSGNQIDLKGSTNRIVRLLLKSYQALSGKRFEAARELADQAGTINPEIAGPQVLKALALFQEGKPAEAKTALLKAQALDPEDKDIDELLKVIQR